MIFLLVAAATKQKRTKVRMIPSIVCIFILLLLFVVTVILITGGWNKETGGSPLTSAEIYNPATGEGCSLPQLPEERHYHSQDGGLGCGGKSRFTTGWYEDCIEWTPASGTWTKHNISEKRLGHVSWATPSGVWLIGGTYSTRSTEKVGSPGESFDLKYDTRYVR